MADLERINVRGVFRPGGISHQAFEVLFEPYATAIGHLVFAWNQLHEALAQLFCAVMGTEDRAIPLAAWYSTPMDRPRREMLRKASEAAFRAATSHRKAFHEEVKWLLTECDKLEDRRNDTVHAPLTYSLTDDGPEFSGAYLLGNPRAEKLKGKQLLSEFRWYRRCAYVLADYAENLAPSLQYEPITLPRRPRLPPRRHPPDKLDTGRKPDP